MEGNNLIPGYIHPNNATSSRGGIYKTFTEGKKAKKKEKFGNTTIGSLYSVSTSSSTQDNQCPTCSQPASTICNCSYSDKKCPNGHIWYTARDGKLKMGNPH